MRKNKKRVVLVEEECTELSTLKHTIEIGVSQIQVEGFAVTSNLRDVCPVLSVSCTHNEQQAKKKRLPQHLGSMLWCKRCKPPPTEKITANTSRR